MMNAHEYSKWLEDLRGRELEAMADFIEALAEFHREKLWRELGYESLHAYLVQHLGMSDGAAHLRVKAVELVGIAPAALEALRTGELCISTMPTIMKCINAKNCGERLPQFFGASRKE